MKNSSTFSKTKETKLIQNGSRKLDTTVRLGSPKKDTGEHVSVISLTRSHPL